MRKSVHSLLSRLLRHDVCPSDKDAHTEDWYLKYSAHGMFLYERRNNVRIIPIRHCPSSRIDSGINRGVNPSLGAPFRRGLATPFFFKPNIVVDPNIGVEKLPLEMKYGRNITADRNMVSCSVLVRNVPPKGYRRVFTAKGKARARHLGAALLTHAEGEPTFIAPLRWMALVERPTLLP
jgi:hypothetical protein